MGTRGEITPLGWIVLIAMLLGMLFIGFYVFGTAEVAEPGMAMPLPV